MSEATVDGCRSVIHSITLILGLVSKPERGRLYSHLQSFDCNVLSTVRSEFGLNSSSSWNIIENIPSGSHFNRPSITRSVCSPDTAIEGSGNSTGDVIVER